MNLPPTFHRIKEDEARADAHHSDVQRRKAEAECERLKAALRNVIMCADIEGARSYARQALNQP